MSRRHVMSCHVMSCHAMSCHVMSCHVMSCHLTSSYVVSYLDPESCSRIFLPSLLNSSIRAAGWQRRGSRNRGPVRESGSERRSRCGAACTASVRVWRRAHFCRVRVAGCGDRACWRCVAGMSRACRGAVPWGLGSGRVLYTRGERAFRVAGCGDRARWRCAAGMSRACRGRLGGAVPWGLGSGRVARTHDVTRCDLRFAWQLWDFGCIDALGKALDGGSAWQVWGNVYLDVAARVFGRCGAKWPPEVSRRWIRVAGVGKRARSVRFAWQAWGMVRPAASLGIVLRGRRRESYTVAKIAGFRGPVRQIACACARSRVGRCEVAAGAGNPWICGCELGADVSWNAAAGCVGRVAYAALCRGTQWQAVTMGFGRVARVAWVALCHGDCWWARRVGAAVPWGLLVGVSRGCRCAMGIAGGRVAWVALCHEDCWAARPLGGAVS